MQKYCCFAVILAAGFGTVACGGSESAESAEDAAGMADERPAASPEAVAAAEALVARLSASELALVPTQRGLVDIEYTQPRRRRGSRFTVTTMRIRNQSQHAIAGFEINEVWYDENGTVVTGGQVRFRDPIMPQQVIDVELQVPTDPDMQRSNTEFDHQNGDVRQSLVPELPDPVEEEEEEAEDA